MPDPVYPLVAIRDDGSTIVAACPAEAVAFGRLNPGVRHVQTTLWISHTGVNGAVWRSSTVRHEWIVRDALGAVVGPHDLPVAPRRVGWYLSGLLAAQRAADRGLPIPRTGRRRRYRRGFRDFRMNMAMRAAEDGLDADLEDWGVGHMNVGRRRSRDLPQVCDDVPWRHKRTGWKGSRATQWR